MYLEKNGCPEEMINIEIRKLFLYIKMKEPMSHIRSKAKNGEELLQIIKTSADEYDIMMQILEENKKKDLEFKEIKALFVERINGKSPKSKNQEGTRDHSKEDSRKLIEEYRAALAPLDERLLEAENALIEAEKALKKAKEEFEKAKKRKEELEELKPLAKAVNNLYATLQEDQGGNKGENEGENR